MVTLDLHGARVDDAERLVVALLRAASVRGRTTVRIIHGTSTSDAASRNRTIKHALYALLDQGRLPGVTSQLRNESDLTLGLPFGPGRDPARLRLSDLQ